MTRASFFPPATCWWAGTIKLSISACQLNERLAKASKIASQTPRLSQDEIIEVITHLAFYAGWPPAMTALQIARKVFDEMGG